MIDNLLNFIFPNICGFCNRIDKNSLCYDCEKMLSKYELDSIEDYKKDKSKYYDYLFCTLRYEGIVREKIIEYKFGEKSYLHKTFSKILLNNKKIFGFIKLYDIIIPVPMHKNRESVRGYNQCKLIAKELAKETGLIYGKNILFKIKDTNVQSTLTKIERYKNIKNAFEVRKKETINNKKIVLLDDIYTTGSTVNECSKVLKQAGAKEIIVITIAKD